jgi:L-seryl-tRNA(Ser) seleniumtransferase
MSAAASHPVALEIDPASSARGGRMREIAALVRLLTGAEETLVVNNNAAAILLVLSALANGRSVIVSRGEAVEIGGGFRIPDVLRQSGARLVEVGTTNRTYPRDYESAIDDTTAVLLKVHPSNFQISGFAASTSVAELAEIARRTKVPIVEDLGSGALLDTTQFSLDNEPTIGDSLANGAAVTTASGDKLLGGPQAGIIAGRADLVEIVARHPLARAVRADKTCLAGIAATLRHYVRGDAVSAIPIWQMISASAESLHERGTEIRARLRLAGVMASIMETMSTIGGGSLPGQRQETVAIALESDSTPVDELASRLRTAKPGVYGRIENGQLLLDLRTVLPEQDDALIDAVATALSSECRP